MRRLPHLVAFVTLVTLLAGCTRPQPAAPPKGPPAVDERPEAKLDARPQPPDVKVEPRPGQPGEPGKLPEPLFAVDPKQEKYEAALTEALGLLADRKLEGALVALETARTFDDNDFIRGEIAKVKQRIEQDSSVRETVRNIESVLEEGKASEAAKLAGRALQEFGGREEATKLVSLRLQAEALQTVQKDEGADARFARLRDEGEAALQEKNLRAAAIAFEQALLARPDPAVQKRADDVRGRLEQYDAQRRRAAELREDATQLEDALHALKQAQQAWDTLQVRQELDEYTLALQRRRDTVSVADFEVRTDLGIPEAGRAIAEELLPRMKARFDLVERGQLGKVLAELKLEQGVPEDPEQQREVGRLAKVRYLVLGSVYRLAGITVQARLVDVRTGLVVQTAKVVAPTAEEAVALVPELGRQLLMNDEEKAAYDAEVRERTSRRPAVVEADAPLPPPPAPPAPDFRPVAADVFDAPAPPPAFGGLRVDVFRDLPPAPAVGAAPQIAFGGAAEFGVKQRLLQVAVQRGDFFFRIGRFHDAHRQFEFALNLAPGNFDVRVRLDRCRPLVPPDFVVVQPIFAARPRVAVLSFLTVGDPRVVPPHLAFWAPQQLSPYFRSRYDVVDPGEVYWYMGRLGMTMNDLMTNPHARRWLGRAVGVRYFLLGTVEQTASFDVSTYLLDAEFGYLQGSARLHVRNQYELKLRLAELAQLTLLDPAERGRMVAEERRYEELILRGRRHADQRDFVVAVKVFEDALRLRPGAVQVRVYLNQTRSQARLIALEEERRQQFLAQKAAAEAARQRQWELAQAAELARARAAQEAALLADEQRRQREQYRLAAQSLLIKQAQVSLKTRNFNLSVSTYESAVSLAPRRAVGVAVPIPVAGDPYRELAQARAEQERASQARAAELAAQREAGLRAKREQELAQARERLKEEQKKAEQERLAQRQRDEEAYTKSVNEGKRLLTANNYDGAVAAFQAAARLKKTELVDGLLELALDRQAEARTKNDAERKELERKLLAERERRKKAEQEAKRNQELYADALQLAQKALADRRYDEAQAKFEEAGKVFQTDVVLTGLRQVQTARADESLRLKKVQEAQQKGQRIKDLLAQGQKALDAGNFAAAVAALQQAKKLAPDDVDVLAGLSRAEQARDRAAAEARRKTEDAERQQNFERLLKSGRENLTAKQYDAAVVNLTAALKLNPGDAAAGQALKQAEAARAASATDAKAKAELAKRTDAYQKLLADGRLALAGKRYDDAIKSFADAQKLLPGDAASKGFLADAQKAKKDATDAVELAAKKRADELKKADDVQKALTQSRTALAARDLTAAAKALDRAKQLDPANADVARGLRDLQQAEQLAKTEAAAKQKVRQQHQDLLDAGRKALASKQYGEAVKALAGAAALAPDDKAGQDLLRQAQAQLKQSQAATTGAARLQELIKSGQAALKAKDYPAAAKALGEANQLDPKNAAVQQALRDLDDARKGAADAEARQAAYLKARAAGEKALVGKDYADAVKSLAEAARLMPGDPQTAKLLQQAQKALDDARGAQADQAKRQALYLDAIKAGQSALAAKKLDDAVKSFTEAGRLMPGDAKAKLFLQQAQADLKQQQEADAKLKQERQKKAAFAGVLKQADSALAAKKYADAKRLYEDALQLMPRDATALRGLRDATEGLTPPKTKTPPVEPKKTEEPKKTIDAKKAEEPKKPVEPKKAVDTKKTEEPKKTVELKKTEEPKKTPAVKETKVELQKALQDAAKLEQQGKYAEAMKAYEDALKLAPKDAQASAGQKRAELNWRIGEGQKHLDAKRYVEAVREFEAALRVAPGNATVQKLLQKAKQGKK